MEENDPKTLFLTFLNAKVSLTGGEEILLKKASGSGLGYCELLSSIKKFALLFSSFLLIWSFSFLWFD
jgi:hypothetical protein